MVLQSSLVTKIAAGGAGVGVGDSVGVEAAVGASNRADTRAEPANIRKFPAFIQSLLFIAERP
jgi:hypothetical protein